MKNCTYSNIIKFKKIPSKVVTILLLFITILITSFLTIHAQKQALATNRSLIAQSDIQGPGDIQGPPGPQGPPGATGLPGATGIPGRSPACGSLNGQTVCDNKNNSTDCTVGPNDPETNKGIYESAICRETAVCGPPGIWYRNSGMCVQRGNPIPCDPVNEEDRLHMTVNPGIITENQPFTLKVTGNVGRDQTYAQYVSDVFTSSSGDVVDCGVNKITNEATCNGVKAGEITWSHGWWSCAADTCGKGQYCNKKILFKVYSGPTAALAAPPPDCENGGNPECSTAIGMFKATDLPSFIKKLYIYLLGIAGVSAFVLLIYAGYLLMVSEGDKQKVMNAREIITAAIVGLLFIILSFALLQFIGVTVLKIPGFGG